MTTPPFLTDMPNNVLEIIVGYSGYVGIQLFRKVCHDLRNFIDDIHPSSDLLKISIESSPESIRLHLESPEKSDTVTYSKHLSGCQITHKYGEKSRKRYFNKENFLEFFQKDFQKILENLKNLKKLAILRDSLPKTDPISKGIFSCFQKILAAKPRPLALEKLKIKVKTEQEVMSILPYLQPGVLDEIQILHPIFTEFSEILVQKSLEAGEIVKTEQWKMARNLKMPHFSFSAGIQNLAHFSNSEISMKTISVGELKELKEALKLSANFTTFSINYDKFIDPPRALRSVFGEPQLNQNDVQVGWFWRIPARKDVLSMFHLTHMSNINFTLFDDFMVPPYVVLRD